MQSNDDLARYARNHRARNPERVRAYEREYKRQRRIRDPEPVREYERRAYGERKRYSRYGVSPEWFRDQLVGQAGRCAICANVFSSDRDTHIDHDHVTGQNRGLLCFRCNCMLGHARDSAETLEKAIAYLRRETWPVEQQ